MRHDPDGSLHIEGGDSDAWGVKHVIVSTRSAEHRVILDTEFVPASGYGGEAGVALECFRRLAPLAPGAQGIVYDGAMRGAHIDAIMTELGLLTINKVHAAEVHVRKGRKGGRRRPKERLIETKEVRLPDGSTEMLPIYSRDGAAGIGKLNVTGDMAFVPLERVRTQRHGNLGGGYRFYNQYRLPIEYGGAEITVRLHGNEDDKKQKLNRAENLRAIPFSDPDFASLYARRNDAESINRGLEDTLYLGRAHSVGHVGQQADLLGFALMVNAITYARHRAREHIDDAAA